MSEQLSKLVIFEGVQGSGKTTAAGRLAVRGYVTLRGIPSGEDLAANKEWQNWRQSQAILEVVTSESGSMIALDRSIWSLVAYNIRKNPEHCHLLYKLGRNRFKKSLPEGTNCTLVILDSSPETVFAREEDRGDHFYLTPEDAMDEAKIYDWLVQRLEGDGFDVVRVCNDGISIDEFYDRVEQMAGITH